MKKVNKKISILLLISILISPLVMNFTESILHNLIIRSFNLIRGKGFVSLPVVEIIYDEEGIPLTIYPDIGKQRYPVSIAQKGLENYEIYQRSKSEEYKEKFLKIADYLAKTLKIKGDYGVWECEFPWKHYNMTPPWISGMAQGQGLEVLGKAYKLTEKEEYLIKAKLVLNSFYKDIPEGVRAIENNGWWYDEYIDENGKNPKVLNGMIFTLQALYNFYNDTDILEAKKAFEKGIIALKQSLHKYDCKGWSYYDRIKTPAPKIYHKIHISQMEFLYKLTGEKIFYDYYKDWKQDFYSPFKHYLLAFVFPRVGKSYPLILIITVCISFLFLLIISNVIKKLK